MTMGEVRVTRPPKSSAAPPPGAGAPPLPAVPPQPLPQQRSGGGAPPGSPPPAPRRTAFAEGVDRLRAAATTEPGRLRIIGALLAVLVLAFGAVTAWQMN